MDALSLATLVLRGMMPPAPLREGGPDATETEGEDLFAELVEETTSEEAAPDARPIPDAAAALPAPEMALPLPEADATALPPPDQADTALAPSRLESILSGWTGMSAGLAPARPEAPSLAAVFPASATALGRTDDPAEVTPCPDETVAVASDEMPAPVSKAEAEAEAEVEAEGSHAPRADMPKPPMGAGAVGAAPSQDALPDSPSADAAPVPAPAPTRELPAVAGSAAAPALPAPAALMAAAAAPAGTRVASPVIDEVASPRRTERGAGERALARLYDLATHGAGPAPSSRLVVEARAAARVVTAADQDKAGRSDLQFDLAGVRDLTPGTIRGEGLTLPSGTPRPPDHHAAAISRQIANVAVTLGKDEIELALAPEELGKLRLRVSRGEGHAPVVTVWFERPEVLETARRHLDQLMQDLHDSGLEGAQLDLRGEGGGQGSRPDAEATGREPSPAIGDGGPGGTPVAAHVLNAPRQLSDRHLDIRV